MKIGVSNCYISLNLLCEFHVNGYYGLILNYIFVPMVDFYQYHKSSAATRPVVLLLPPDTCDCL